MATAGAHTLERQPGEGIQLAIDDAFADDDDQLIEFSSEAVRSHLAEQLHWATETPGDEPDASISTLHLDGKSDSASLASRTSPAVEQPRYELSSIPLSEPGEQKPPPPPAVHIDISQPPSNRVSVMPEAASGKPSLAPSTIDLPRVTASAPLPTTQVPPPQNHKQSRPTGPSTLQMVVSKTRPHFLPPKKRHEDLKHLADWEAMMKRSRAAEEKRQKASQERRLARELQVEQSIHTWEKVIFPDWRAVHRDPGLRKLWWNGIPTKLRASMWERAVGNALTLSKDNYRSCLARAKRLSQETLQTIEQDILVTLPALRIFRPDGGPLYQDLKDLLCAWIVSRVDEGLGYTPGVARIAAMILVNMPAPQGFVVMRNLLERHCLRSFYGNADTKEDVEAYYRIFDTLLADSMPKIYFNFKQHQISPAAYLPGWIIPLFLDHLPFDACARLWDVVMLEGDSFLFRAALAILAVLEPRLFFPERQELLGLLNGENKAAIEVARRDGRALDGGKYEIYGVDEDTLWDRIESMSDWWRETTWTRLTQRELPDI